MTVLLKCLYSEFNFHVSTKGDTLYLPEHCQFNASRHLCSYLAAYSLSYINISIELLVTYLHIIIAT